MKVFFSLLISLIIIVVLFSCNRVVYIGKRTDPEIILKKGHHDIVFVNLFDYTLPVNANKKDKISYHAGVMNLLDGLSSFSSDSSFNFLVGDTLKKSKETGILTTLLPIDTINAICKRLNTNLLLALDSVSIFFEQDTVINNYYGRKYRTINFVLNTSFFLSLYSDDGYLIDRSEVDQSSIFSPRTVMPGFILVPSVSGAGEEIENLAYQAGQDYVSKFYPQLIKETKQLFSGKLFKESNNYIFSKNWSKATELLEQLVKNKDPEISGKARHNLEVAKEASEADSRFSDK
jgi:hypothetical protein